MSIEFKSTIHRYSLVAGLKPAPAELFAGEIGINIADSKLYTKNINGIIVDLTPFTGLIDTTGAVNDDVLVFNSGTGKYRNVNLSVILDGGTF